MSKLILNNSNPKSLILTNSVNHGKFKLDGYNPQPPTSSFIAIGKYNKTPNLGVYSYDNGDTWNNFDYGGYTPTYTIFNPAGLGSYTTFSPKNTNDIMLWSRNTSGRAQWHMSRDGGQTFNSGVTGTSTIYQYTFFVKNTDDIYITGWGGQNLKSTMDTWPSYTSLTTASVIMDASDDGDYLYSYKNTGYVEYSTNGGVSWTSVHLPSHTSHGIMKCDASGQYVFYYYGGGNTPLLMSNDYGHSFTGLTANMNARVCLNRDASLFVYNGSDSNIYYSTNQGTSWSTVASPYGTGTTQFRQNFTTNKIYTFCTDDNRIYEINGSGLTLKHTTTYTIYGFEHSQYSDKFLYNQSANNNVYLVDNWGTEKLVYNSGNTYLLVY